MNRGTHWTRRRFLQTATAAAFPLLLPARIARAQGVGAPNERIVTGHIGMGPAGRAHLPPLRGAIAAVCDVDEKRLYEGAALAGPGAEVYTDYRRILDRKDIDAIVIATPDHWHATMALDAIETGKDVYLETPACRTLGEGLRLARAGRYFGAVVQAGLGGIHEPGIAGAVAALAAGQEATAWGAANPAGGNPAAAAEVPEGLDWNAWLGPLRPRAYNPDTLHGGDRWILGLGGGQVRQQGASLFEVALAAWQLHRPGLVEVYAEGLPQRAGLWDCPQTLRASIAFPDEGQVIRWTQDAGATDCGLRLAGENEALELKGHGTAMRQTQSDVSPQPATLATWQQAIRARQPNNEQFETAVLAASLGTLVNLSFRLGRKLRWRPADARFEKDPVANRFVEDDA